MLGLNSGLLGVRRVPTIGSASGLWVPNEQSLAKRAEIWPVAGGDPNFADVSLLLHMEGADTSTSFTDSSNNAVSVTANGNAQISTAQSKFGSSSGLFDGTGDYLQTPSSALFNFGAGTSFTVECFARFDATNTSGKGIFSQRRVDYGTFEIRQESSGYSWLIGNAAVNDWHSTSSSSSGLISANTWYHLALVGDGTNLKLFHDGTQVLTVSQPAWTSANRVLYIGGGGDGDHDGYIDELRVTKSVARYTSNFTPPAAAFPNA